MCNVGKVFVSEPFLKIFVRIFVQEFGSKFTQVQQWHLYTTIPHKQAGLCSEQMVTTGCIIALFLVHGPVASMSLLHKINEHFKKIKIKRITSEHC